MATERLAVGLRDHAELTALARDYLTATAIGPTQDASCKILGEAFDKHIQDIQDWLHAHPDMAEPVSIPKHGKRDWVGAIVAANARKDRRNGKLKPTALFLSAVRYERAQQKLDKAFAEYQAEYSKALRKLAGTGIAAMLQAVRP